MTVLFAIEEAGTFSYLEPLFRAWLAQGRKGWQVYAGEDLERFPRFAALCPDLPLTDAGEDRKSILITSLGKTSENLTEFYKSAVADNMPRIGILDVWDKVWNAAHFPVTHFFTVDEAQKESMTATFPSVNCTVIGQPAWEDVPALPKARAKHVLFAGQPIRRFYGHSLGYDEHSAWDMLKDAVLADEHTVSYALHPVQNMAEVRAHIGQKVEICTDMVETMQTHGTLVSPFSSALIEAWLGGRRNVISLQPHIREEDSDKCVLSRKGLIPRASNAAELRVLLYRPALPRTENPFKGSLVRLEQAIRVLCE